MKLGWPQTLIQGLSSGRRSLGRAIASAAKSAVGAVRLWHGCAIATVIDNLHHVGTPNRLSIVLNAIGRFRSDRSKIRCARNYGRQFVRKSPYLLKAKHPRFTCPSTPILASSSHPFFIDSFRQRLLPASIVPMFLPNQTSVILTWLSVITLGFGLEFNPIERCISGSADQCGSPEGLRAYDDVRSPWVGPSYMLYPEHEYKVSWTGADADYPVRIGWHFWVSGGYTSRFISFVNDTSTLRWDYSE